MRKRNQYEGVCKRCGVAVAAGAGWVDTRRNQETLTVEYVVEHETCPTETAKPDERHEMPLSSDCIRLATSFSGTALSGASPRTSLTPSVSLPISVVPRQYSPHNGIS